MQKGWARLQPLFDAVELKVFQMKKVGTEKKVFDLIMTYYYKFIAKLVT